MKRKVMRVDRLLSNLGYCNRSSARAFIRTHDVTVSEGGVDVARPLVNARVKAERVKVGGKHIPYLRPLSLIMHKPRGYTCSHRREQEDERLVFDLLPEAFGRRNPKLAIAGRLDRWASGLLILSQNGQLVNKVIDPSVGHEKVYEVQVEQEFTGKEKELFESGKLLINNNSRSKAGSNEPYKCLPAGFEYVDSAAGIARVTLREGKYHQLRRMLAAVGHSTAQIRRLSVAGIELSDDLPEGHWREMTLEEVEGFVGPLPQEEAQELRDGDSWIESMSGSSEAQE